MPQTFTLDTNCLIDVADKRPAAKAVQALADAHAAGRADAAVVAITASENSEAGITARILQNFVTV
jgi:predicted nucleic acid-binding protein